MEYIWPLLLLVIMSVITFGLMWGLETLRDKFKPKPAPFSVGDINLEQYYKERKREWAERIERLCPGAIDNDLLSSMGYGENEIPPKEILNIQILRNQKKILK